MRLQSAKEDGSGTAVTLICQVPDLLVIAVNVPMLNEENAMSATNDPEATRISLLLIAKFWFTPNVIRSSFVVLRKRMESNVLVMF